jgi:hypothetical protein
MNRKVMRVCCFVLFLASLILLGLARPTSALAQESSRSTSSADRKISFGRTITTPCAEKKVRLNGEFQAQFSVTRDPSGDTFLRADFDAGRITAFGVTSGRKYEVNGTSHIDSRGPSPTEFTYVFNFALNKVRSFDSLMGHAKFRIKVDARAQATTEIIEVIIDCNN